MGRSLPPELLEAQAKLQAERRERVADVLALGLGVRESAERLGISERSVQRWMIALGLREPRRIAPRRVDDAWRAKAEALFDEGAPKRAVADITGVSLNTVKRHFPDRGMSPSECGVMGYAGMRLSKL